jgi:hypothetical protein
VLHNRGMRTDHPYCKQGMVFQCLYCFLCGAVVKYTAVDDIKIICMFNAEEKGWDGVGFSEAYCFGTSFLLCISPQVLSSITGYVQGWGPKTSQCT